MEWLREVRGARDLSKANRIAKRTPQENRLRALARTVINDELVFALQDPRYAQLDGPQLYDIPKQHIGEVKIREAVGNIALHQEQVLPAFLAIGVPYRPFREQSDSVQRLLRVAYGVDGYPDNRASNYQTPLVPVVLSPGQLVLPFVLMHRAMNIGGMSGIELSKDAEGIYQMALLRIREE